MQRLEAAICSMPQFNGFRTRHWFANGMYCRAVWRPATVTVIGARHRHEHLTMLISGTIIVSGEGVEPVEYTAPAIFVSPAGTKRATYAVTDAELVTIHRLSDPNERDPEKVEADILDVENDRPRLFDANNKLKDPALEDQSAPRIEEQTE
jgi:hypothetical protein